MSQNDLVKKAFAHISEMEDCQLLAVIYSMTKYLGDKERLFIELDNKLKEKIERVVRKYKAEYGYPKSLEKSINLGYRYNLRTPDPKDKEITKELYEALLISYSINLDDCFSN